MSGVAAGTCACGQGFASAVRTAVCLDATPAMLEVVRREAETRGLDNMAFVRGLEEALPFLDASFGTVPPRLAFHHFADVGTPFAGMVWVPKPGGKLVMTGMEAANEARRGVEEGIGTRCGPSHVHNLGRAEMLGLSVAHGLAVQACGATRIQQGSQSWMPLAEAP